MGKKPNWSNPFSTYSILPHVLRTTTKFLAFLFLPYLESFPYSFSSLVALVSCSLNLSTWPLCLCFSKLRNNPCSRLLFHPNEKLFSRFIHLVLPSSRAAHQKISRPSAAIPPHPLTSTLKLDFILLPHPEIHRSRWRLRLQMNGVPQMKNWNRFCLFHARCSIAMGIWVLILELICWVLFVARSFFFWFIFIDFFIHKWWVEPM